MFIIRSLFLPHPVIQEIYSVFIIIRHNLSAYMFPNIMRIYWPISKIFFLNLVLLPSLLTYRMEQSPSLETNRFSASQVIPRILWNPKVHYHIYNCPPTVPILSYLDPVHTPTSYFLNILLNIISPSTPGSSNWFLSLCFPTKNLYTTLLSPVRGPCPSYRYLGDSSPLCVLTSI